MVYLCEVCVCGVFGAWCLSFRCVHWSVCGEWGVSLKGGCTMDCVLSCVCVRCVNGEV